MSIPPLVCSTPPPPDQCEDEKEPVDFDLSYHLSQDEDEEDAGNSYGFSSYSKYDHYSSPLPESNSIDIPVSEVKNDIGIENNVTNTPQQSKNVSAEKTSEETNIDINNHIESKLNSEDDMNIEDLDLKIDQESTVINDKEVIEDNIEVSNTIVDCSNKNSHTYYPEIPDIGQDDPFTPPESGGSEECSIEEIKNSDKIESLNTLNEEVLEISENLGQEETINVESNMPQSIENTKDDQLVLNKIDHMADDDFGDFEENLIPTCKSSVVLDDKNPWENDETGCGDFEKFEANFDENTDICNPSLQIENSNDNIVHVNETENNSYEDDDFGDFDDFQSSTIESRQLEEDISCQQMSVLELHSPDNESQAIESINKILFTIFKDDISESDCEFDGKLESLLCETWGHLLDTDVRQPYVVNWNSSLGQQTLLKSLCIDSRNILYGPKWTSGMPKYAANLTSAPLQPQKQSTQSNVNPNEAVDVDKCSAKTGTWSDPFISDGQESCNKEPQNAQSTSVPTRPSTLDVFEDPSIPRSDKIFSNTINIQPMRQINLPDTHIFTPTDSETPRSKTIHYDSSPAVLRPQTKENNISDKLSVNNEPEDSVEDFDDYSEFQDFKGASEHVKPIENEKTNATNIPKYETQILQPIKVEPIMPTLNWPDPGHVKETFDDFSDFVSSSSWPGDKQESIKQETPEIIQEQMTSDVSKEEFDDDFDTFQSAPSSVNNNLPLDTRIQNNESISVRNQTEIPKHIPKNNDFPTADRKADKISRIEIPNDVSVHSQTNFTPNNLDNTNKTGIISPPITQSGVSILQPTQASTLHNQSKSTQILQPLSLESFSQINWPNPGIDLQDLSRFNPVETLSSLKIDSMSNSKSNSPAHIPKPSTHNQTSADDDIWGEFVSSKPVQKKQPVFVEDDEWTDFVSSPSIKPQNGLNTISFNVHTNSSVQISNQRLKASKPEKTTSLDIPTLNYITPKSNNHSSYKSRHFQNL